MTDRFRIERVQEGDVTTIVFHGVIDEGADLSFLSELRGRVRLNLRHLRRINSFGVKSWMHSISRVPPSTTVELLECPPPIVDQANILKGFLGRAEVVSFLATYLCPQCDEEVDVLLRAKECREGGYVFPERACPDCREPMEPNELESLYLRFLRERE